MQRNSTSYEINRQVLFVKIRNTVLCFKYKYFLNPVLFLFDPETIHNLFISIGKTLRNAEFSRNMTSFLFNYSSPLLEQKILDNYVPEKGGISGRVVQDLTDNLISYVYKKTKDKYVIIGCGGIFSAEDAYRKIKLGASLVQLITGMIYKGPQLISQINLELVDFLKKDGYKNISEAVGKAH